MLERNQPGLLNPHTEPGVLNPIGASVRGALQPARQFQPTVEWFFADKGAGEVDTKNTYGAAPTFTRATTATTVLSNGLIGSVASGVPRFWYDPTTLVPLGYLAEGARTNICLQSEVLATTWSNVNSTDQANAIAAPDGNVTADSITDDSTSGEHFVSQSLTVSNATAYTLSVFAKAGTLSYVWLRDNSTVTATAFFNLSTGTVGTVSGTGSPTATIKAYPNGWYRCTMTFTTAGTTANYQLGVAEADATTSYSGTGKLAYVWGMQHELGAFASSYIPTTTASVTRNADVLTYDTTGWFNSSAGTLFSEGTLLISATGQNPRIASIDNNATTESYIFDTIGSSSRFLVIDDGVTQAVVSSTAIAQGAIGKFAGAYAVNDFAFSCNGGTVGTDTAGTLPTPTQLSVGGLNAANPWSGPIRRVQYFNTRLSNQHLQILTAL